MTTPLVPTSSQPGTPGCCAGQNLVLVGTAPAVGPFPELRTYRCSHCGHVETIEAPRAPAH